MGTIGVSGYSTLTFAQYKTLLQTAFTTAFGASIDLSDQSPQGVWINDQADLMAQADASGLNSFNQLNLDTATGLALDFIAIVRGTLRSVGTDTVINCTFTSTSQPYAIPVNTEFKILSTSKIYENTAQINITNTTQTNVQLTSQVTGLDSDAIISALLSAQVYIPQLTNIIVTSVTYGTDAETDNDLRLRLKTINSISSKNDVDAIYSALKALSNVSKVVVFENDTGSTDAKNLPAHSINAVVLGDTDQHVVDTIFLKKPAGTLTYGASSASATDTQGFKHLIYFDRPTKTNIYIAATVTAKEYQTAADTSYNDAIRQACTAYVSDLLIGQDVSYTSVFGFFATPQAFDITALKMSLNPVASTFAASNVTVPIRSYSIIEVPATSIVVTVI
jgi:hypothetical protein